MRNVWLWTAFALAAIAMVAFRILIRVGTRPLVHRTGSEELERYLGELLRRGYQCGFAVIQDDQSERFVQLSKYIRSNHNIGIELSFPNAEWSREYFPRVKVLIEGAHLPVRLVPGDAGVSEFLMADFGRNVRSAAEIVDAIFVNIFDVAGPRKYRIEFGNTSVHDELIDTEPITKMKS